MKQQHSLSKLIIFSIITTTLFFFSFEAFARVYFAIKYRNGYYLRYGFIIWKTEKEITRMKVWNYKVKTQYITSNNVTYLKMVPGTYDYGYKNTLFKVRINNHGFRGKDFEEKKPDGVYRIICMGGSSTLGLEVEDGLDYPSLLEKELAALTKRKIEVINTGFINANSKETLDLFKGEIVKYQPDLVTFYEGFNDYHFFVDDITPVARMSLFLAIPKLYSFLYNKSLLFAILTEKLTLYKYAKYDKSKLQNIVDVFSGNIRDLIDIAHRNNAEVLLAQQCIWIEGYNWMKDKSLIPTILAKIESGRPISREEAYCYLHFSIYMAIDKIAKEKSVTIVDLYKELTKYDPGEVSNDIVHLTNKGNEIIAHSISTDVVPKIIKSGLRNPHHL